MNQILNYRRIVAFLPNELKDLVKSYCNPYEEHWQKQVDDIAEKYDLNKNGFKEFGKTESVFHKFKKCDLKNIIKCKNQIPHIFRPLKTYSKYCVGSYGGKHDVERYRNKQREKDPYISNGQLIVEMIMNGYIPKQYGINCEFKAKTMDKYL